MADKREFSECIVLAWCIGTPRYSAVYVAALVCDFD